LREPSIQATRRLNPARGTVYVQASPPSAHVNVTHHSAYVGPSK
jgi:hypothetical protein